MDMVNLVLAYLLLTCLVHNSVVLANVAVTCLVQTSTTTSESNKIGSGGAGKCVVHISLYLRV